MNPRIRVLLVDDSALIRRMIRTALEAEAGFEVVGTAGSGVAGLAQLEAVEPDVIVLDLEMPEMDGLTMLKELRRRHSQVGVVVFSSLTERGATATVDALCAGANDYLCKPERMSGARESIEWLRRALVPKLTAARVRPPDRPSELRSIAAAPSTPSVLPARAAEPSAAPGASSPRLLAASTSPLAAAPALRAVAVGASVGGPPALVQVISALPARIPLPVFIVQHMAPVFTKALAQRIASFSKIPVHEAEHGARVQPGHAYVAAGDFHLRVVDAGAGPQLALDQGPLENGCRPAVDVLFRSAAALYGPSLLALVMTGTGSDGTKGAGSVRAAGGRIWAQDQASSAAWGMPGSVIQRGFADGVYPLAQIGRELALAIEPRLALAGPRGTFA